MTTNPPQHANFSEIFYPDGSCGVVDGLRDCMQPGVVLAADPLEPEPKTATWFCSKHWAEFEAIYSVVEDKREKDDLPGLPEVVADKINVANAERDWHEKGSE